MEEDGESNGRVGAVRCGAVRCGKIKVGGGRWKRKGGETWWVDGRGAEGAGVGMRGKKEGV